MLLTFEILKLSESAAKFAVSALSETIVVFIANSVSRADRALKGSLLHMDGAMLEDCKFVTCQRMHSVGAISFAA